MMMVYAIALAIGGTLLLVSLVFGSHADIDADIDVDIGADIDAPEIGDVDPASTADGADALDAVLSWLPIKSVRFWTFFFAFAGLTGVTLLGLELAGQTLTGVLAVATGYLSGIAVVATMRHLSATSNSTSVEVGDYVGALGSVLLPVEPGTPGKVRLHVKGRDVDLLAETEDKLPLQPKDSVLVYGLSPQGHVLVTRSDQDTSNAAESL